MKHTPEPPDARDAVAEAIIAEEIASRLTRVFHHLFLLMADAGVRDWIRTRQRFDDICVSLELFDYTADGSDARLRVFVYHPELDPCYQRDADT